MKRTYFSLLSSALVVLAAASVASCAPGPSPVSQSVADPSSPSAPEGPPVALVEAPTLSAPSPPTAPADAHSHHAHGHDVPAASSAAPAQGVTYVCPMDPDVTSKSPGVCPKCNMKLVPKK